MKTLKIEVFQTTDLHLAAYLTASGQAQLKAILPTDTWKKSFKLSPSPSEEVISQFYTGHATTSALRLCESLRNLKAAIRYQEGSNGN